ncbi:hypothetical protein QUV83_06855 [Cellulomonas cellasea]|uniref:hypothetical protein n=1 Tax=Cellulomonas cellasea TaxID=43670 RepID=UPI0025A3F8F0|nr:hypothetical protein [Cellulomonas cellasea]MDM8084476.1 hypothetical protein [Cellulomonas cellasea]
MGWFGRRKGEQEGPADEALPMLTVEQAARFTAAAQRAFAEAGMETVLDGGVLRASEGVLPLHSIATRAAAVPEREWPALLAQHAGVMAPALRGSLDPEPIRDEQVYLRVLERDAIPGGMEVGDDVAGDLVAVLGVDYPDRVETLSGAKAVDKLGGWESVRETGLRNLRALAAEQVKAYALNTGGDLHVSTGGYFHASRLLVLGDVLAADFKLERPRHGVLVAAPNHSLIIVHPIEGLSVLDAMRTLIGMAADQSNGPGGLSDNVFFWRDGVLEQVTRRSEDGGVTVAATGAFGEVLATFG